MHEAVNFIVGCLFFKGEKTMQIGAPEVVMFIGVVLTILNIADKTISLRKVAKEPEEEQNRRLDKLEASVSQIKTYLSSDNERIKTMESGNRVMLHAMSALLAHGIDGNNTENLVRAKEELDEYLINR